MKLLKLIQNSVILEHKTVSENVTKRYYDILTEEIKSTEASLDKITKFRPKRALINALGSAIKFI